MKLYDARRVETNLRVKSINSVSRAIRDMAFYVTRRADHVLYATHSFIRECASRRRVLEQRYLLNEIVRYLARDVTVSFRLALANLQ